jgi:hypothetical protein
MTIQDETPSGPYTEKIVCKYVTGPGRTQCKAVRYCKKQDVHQVRYCKAHAAQATKEKRTAKAKARRAAAKVAS